MKNKSIIILSFLLCLFYETWTVNYQNFFYYDFLGLPQATTFYNDQVEAVLKPLRIKYHPDKTSNFMQKKFYQEYLKILTNIANKLINPPPVTQLLDPQASQRPQAEELKEKINFDFYELMKKQVKQGYFDQNEFLLFYNAAALIPETIPLPYILFGLQSQISNIPLPEKVTILLQEEQSKLNKTLAAISPTREKEIEEAIINAFFYSYVDPTIRNAIVKILIELAQAYKNQKDANKEKEILKETKNIIETEWGTVFPIDNNLKDEINSLLAKLEVAEVPKKVLEDVKNFLNEAKSKFKLAELNVPYLQAIKKLEPYLPTSAPNILEVYLIWAKRFDSDLNYKAYILYLALLDAGKFEANAQTKNLSIPITFTDNKVTIQKELELVPQDNKQNAISYIGKQQKIPQEKLNTANKLIAGAKTKVTPEAVKDLLEAIEEIRPFTPQTSAKIINTYLEIIKKYKDSNDLDNRKKFIEIAQGQAQSLKLVTLGAEKFVKALQDLDNQAQEIGIPPTPPTPTPSPSKALGELNQLLLDLQNKLITLQTTMG